MLRTERITREGGAGMEALNVDGVERTIADLGVVRMRLLVPSSEANGSFAAAEFRGAAGPWTIPHVHRGVEESFLVVDGNFRFTVGEREVDAAEGAFVLVPRGTRHVINAGEGGGALLTIWAPGGLERMFLELGELPADSITDPTVRAAIAERHDSVPV
jgi:mannose-6-phosphate isomerase-like protein (cupin superfamily)